MGLGAGTEFGTPAGTAGKSSDAGAKACGGSNAVKKLAVQDEKRALICPIFSLS